MRNYELLRLLIEIAPNGSTSTSSDRACLEAWKKILEERRDEADRSETDRVYFAETAPIFSLRVDGVRVYRVGDIPSASWSNAGRARLG